MKATIVFFVVLAVALANPLPEAPLTGVESHYTNIRDDFGQYALSYLAQNVAHVEQGSLKRVNGALVLVKQGSYVYIGSDGRRYKTEYIADENGFRPIGDHIPLPDSV